MSRAPSAAVAAVLVLGALSGCAAMPDAAGVPQTAKNRMQWAMPLDEFWVYSPSLDNYAEQLTLGRCITSAGYEWPVPWQNPEFPERDDVNRVGLSLFNEQTASRWGYHDAPSRDEATDRAWLDFTVFVNSYDPDSEFEGVYEKCSRAARDDATAEFASSLSYLNELAMQAEDVAERDPAVIAARSAWRECLSARVEFPVPDDVWAMPPEPLDEEFGIIGPGATKEASSEEIAVAVADAQCRESSRLSELQYEKEWAEQLSLIHANRDQLDRSRVIDRERKKELLHTIAEYSPPAP